MTRLENGAKQFHKIYLEKHRQDEETTRKIDRMMMFIGTMGPLATFIQVVHIFSVKTASGLSMYTWIGYVFVSCCWFGYGYFYQDKPVMIVNSLSLVVNAFIIVGLVIYP